MNQSSTTTTPNAIIGPKTASVPTKARNVGWGAIVIGLIIVAVVVLAMKAFDTGNSAANGSAAPGAMQTQEHSTSDTKPAH